MSVHVTHEIYLLSESEGLYWNKRLPAKVPPWQRTPNLSKFFPRSGFRLSFEKLYMSSVIVKWNLASVIKTPKAGHRLSLLISDDQAWTSLRYNITMIYWSRVCFEENFMCWCYTGLSGSLPSISISERFVCKVKRISLSDKNSFHVNTQNTKILEDFLLWCIKMKLRWP